MNFQFKQKSNLWHILWFLLPAGAGLSHVLRHSYNNYLIYKGVFKHLCQEVNLYSLYPNEYFDSNHYGIFFGLIIAPFSVLPDTLGVTLWVVFHAFVLYQALLVLPLKNTEKWIVLAICLVDLMTSSHNVQVNPSVGALIIFSWYFVRKEKDFWAVMFVLIGTFVKLYGIVGLVFWVFSKHKIKYIYSGLFWFVVLLCLPMLFSSPHFVIQSYCDWYASLVEKNIANQNIVQGMQDVSFMGLVRRLTPLHEVSNLIFLVPAFLLQVLPLLRFKLYDNINFQLRYLASLLIFVVIFSSSSESATYIIAVSGVAIWFITQEKPIQKWVWALLGLVVVFTSLSATDIFPPSIRALFLFYSIKAFPCCLVWFACVWQLWEKEK